MFNAKFIKDVEAELFIMPSLEEEKIISHADLMRKAEEVQRRAYEEGYAVGEKAGRSEGERQAVLLIEQAGAILDELVSYKDNFVTTLESQVLELSFAVAKKILTEEIVARPAAVVSMVRECLQRMGKTGPITIKINPELQDLFKTHRPELAEIHQDIMFEVNANIPIDGPVVVSQTEEVVTDIGSLLQNISADLRSSGKEND